MPRVPREIYEKSVAKHAAMALRRVYVSLGWVGGIVTFVTKPEAVCREGGLDG